jgi:hypothetical protein
MIQVKLVNYIFKNFDFISIEGVVYSIKPSPQTSNFKRSNDGVISDDKNGQVDIEIILKANNSFIDRNGDI